MYMELSSLDKRNLRRDFAYQKKHISSMMDIGLDLATAKSYESFCVMFGVDFNTPIEEVARRIMMTSVNRTFLFIDAGAPSMITFPNFAEGRGYTTEQLKEFITPEFKDYVFSLVPEYVNRNVRGIMNSCAVLREFCRMQSVMTEQDRIDIANGRIPDRLFANRFDWGF